MESLYEAVQSSTDGPPPPVPSHSCSNSCSRSCSPAVLLDDNTKWQASGRSISMVRGLHTVSVQKLKHYRHEHLTQTVTDGEQWEHS